MDLLKNKEEEKLKVNLRKEKNQGKPLIGNFKKI